MTHPSATLILASASPRRRHLLAVLGIPFIVDIADIDERVLSDEAPDAYVLRLAQSKAAVVGARHNAGDVVLAADTIVVQNNRLLGKPADAEDARTMLQALREAPHQVMTAIAAANEDSISAAVHSSFVVMRSYSDREIDDYIESGDPMDKAGAYAIQNRVFHPVAHFDGCFASIMGLPLQLTAQLLSVAGLALEETWPQACAAMNGVCCQLSTATRETQSGG